MNGGNDLRIETYYERGGRRADCVASSSIGTLKTISGIQSVASVAASVCAAACVKNGTRQNYAGKVADAHVLSRPVWLWIRGYLSDPPGFPPDIFGARLRILRALFMKIRRDLLSYNEIFRMTPTNATRKTCMRSERIMLASLNTLGSGRSLEDVDDSVKM